jgi:hypothetical protein
MSDTIEIRMPRKKIHEILDAYRTMEEFLSLALGKKEIYKRDFILKLDQSISEAGQPKKIKNYEDFLEE